MHRKTPFIDIIRGLIPFFVTRQVFAGAGRVGIGAEGRTRGLPALPAGGLLRGRGGPGDDAQAADHQHPRRAARRRGQVPPAARDHRRREPGRAVDLPQGGHDVAGAGDDRGPGAARATSTIEEPVDALQAISHDPSLTAPVRLRDGRQLTALDVQRPTWSGREKFVGRRASRRADRDVLRRWARCWTTWPSTRCAAPTGWTGRPSCGCWRATASRDGLGWGDSRLHLVDLQYSDVRPDKGLYNRLVSRGSMQRLLTDDEVTRAMPGRPRTLGRSSAAGACAGTPRSWPRRPGTRSSSTSAGSTWSRIPTMEPPRRSRRPYCAAALTVHLASLVFDEDRVGFDQVVGLLVHLLHGVRGSSLCLSRPRRPS